MTTPARCAASHRSAAASNSACARFHRSRNSGVSSSPAAMSRCFSALNRTNRRLALRQCRPKSSMSIASKVMSSPSLGNAIARAQDIPCHELATGNSVYIELRLVTRNRRPSPRTVAVLKALVADPEQWRYGYDLCSELGMQAGSMYPILIRLADRGLLEASWEDDRVPGRPARHLYRLT